MSTDIILGPFLGHVTSRSIKIWLHREGASDKAYVTVHPKPQAAAIAQGEFSFKEENLFTDCIKIEGLEPDTFYHYRVWANPAHSIPFNLQGIKTENLYFSTLPEDTDEQLDFLIMSCHNPTVSHKDGHQGHAVWADIPQIISRDSNKKVRFAILAGDQVYADAWREKILNEKDNTARLRLYLDAYRTFWSHPAYRNALCRLPSVMIWDDHDIMDGWGSALESFVGESEVFKPEWNGLFKSATTAFSIMQASRNPEALAEKPLEEGYDFCFKVGRWGFIALDLRTNRNLRKAQLIAPAQLERIKKWVENNKRDLSAVFVISPVVFSHGSPVIDDLLAKHWGRVLQAVDFIAGCTKWGKGMRGKFYDTLGDIRDDIRDSWGAPENGKQTDMILDYLFGLQNDKEKPINVIILSGDIHTSGYANIYSNDTGHAVRASIPHITASSVAYVPFNWILEAVYRHATKTAALGERGVYSSQISHHFCNRNVAVISIRPKNKSGDFQIKAKYYVEGYPEPQILLFDLDQTAHRENITWVAQKNLFEEDYSPSIHFDVEASLKERARLSGQNLNIGESVVDLMKALGMDSSLGARKRLAQQLGYDGPLDGSFEMNVWLQKRVVEKFIDDETKKNKA